MIAETHVKNLKKSAEYDISEHGMKEREGRLFDKDVDILSLYVGILFSNSLATHRS